jgi:hypothetical protein
MDASSSHPRPVNEASATLKQSRPNGEVRSEALT